MENHFWSPIAKLIYTITGIGGSAFGLGKYNANVVKKKELYRDDGSLIYMTTNNFEKSQELFKENVGKEITVMSETVDKISEYLIKKIEEDKKLMHTMGRVEQFMEDHKK